MKTKAVLNAQCAETIALLSLLQPNPGEVDAGCEQSPLPPAEHDRQARTLSATAEQDLAWALSVSSAMTGDSRGAPTVAVQEHPETHRLIVRISVGVAESRPDGDILKMMTEGLERVIRGLQTMSNREIPQDSLHAVSFR